MLEKVQIKSYTYLMNQTGKKKQAILETTFQLLNEKEIKDITVDEIAEKAVVSKVTLFKYYQNKNHLLNLVFLNAFDFMRTQTNKILQSDLNFEATYRALTDMKLDEVERFSPQFQQNLMVQYSNNDSFFDADAVQTQTDIYTQLLKKGRDEGKISATISDDDFLFIVRIFTEGMKGLDADILFKKTDLLTQFFLNGLENKK